MRKISNRCDLGRDFSACVDTRKKIVAIQIALFSACGDTRKNSRDLNRDSNRASLVCGNGPNVKKIFVCIISVLLPLIKFPLIFFFLLSSHAHSLYFKVSANSDNDRLHTLIGKIIIYYHGHVDDVIVQSRLELLQLFLSFYRTMIKALIGKFTGSILCILKIFNIV